MKYLKIDKVKEGMVLVKPIYDENCGLMLNSNTALTKFHINKLKELNYEKLYVYTSLNEIENCKYYNEVISEDIRRNAVKNLKNLNIDAVTFFANKIVNELVTQKDILIDLTDLQGYHDYTYHHSVNVAIISVTIGIGLGLTNQQLKDLSVAAILHDLGKKVIDTKILNKPGKLTPEEYEEIKKHSQFGYNILKDNIDISSVSRVAILHHHENEDGSGYPFGKTSENIPLLAKIIHVADVFDALTSERCYKPAYSPSEAVEYLMGNCGKMFDMKIVNTFIKYISLYPIGSKVLLSDGREAIVLKNHKSAVLRPTIIMENGTKINLKTDPNTLNITIKELLD